MHNAFAKGTKTVHDIGFHHEYLYFLIQSGDTNLGDSLHQQHYFVQLIDISRICCINFHVVLMVNELHLKSLVSAILKILLNEREFGL